MIAINELPSSQTRIEQISLSNLVLDRETQIRVSMCEETVQKYAALMETEAGRAKFPPILLFQDSDAKLWLADGHHRVEAAIRLKLPEILAEIRVGTKADALWAAAEINSKNALPLNKDDLPNAVRMLHDAWPDRSNRALAEVLGCDEKTVRNHRPTKSGADESAPVKRVGKDGKLYPTKANKVGKPKAESLELKDLPEKISQLSPAIERTNEQEPIAVQKVETPEIPDKPRSDRVNHPLRKLYPYYDQEQLSKDLIAAYSPYCVSSLPFAIFRELRKDEDDKETIERMMHDFLNGYIIRQNESQYKPLLADLFDRMYGDDELVDKIMKLIAEEEKNYEL